MELDKTDRRILSVLLKDGRASIEAVAERVNLSPTPVRRRIKRLETEGVITGYGAIVDHAACGLKLTMHAFVRLKSLDPGLIAEFERRIKTMPEVHRCDLVTGSFAYILVLRLENIDKYNSYLRERISQLPGISSILTEISIDSIKDEFQIPI